MKAVISCEKPGEEHTSSDPGMAEWGNPAGAIPSSHTEYIGMRSDTQGTEPSKYPKEKTSTEIP